jgi:hypothetical protein
VKFISALAMTAAHPRCPEIHFRAQSESPEGLPRNQAAGIGDGILNLELLE